VLLLSGLRNKACEGWVLLDRYHYLEKFLLMEMRKILNLQIFGDVSSFFSVEKGLETKAACWLVTKG